MFVRGFRSLHAHFDANGLGDLLSPRKPRNPLLRACVGLVGVAVLAVLLVVGLFVGATMLGGGLVRRAWQRRRSAVDRGGAGVLGAEYRVLRKPAVPLAR
ncbi:MAG TPA: hypothetical protein VLK29_08885 [Luteimonas sp.]|nr:hypothetical protein [Luteimonas sp.]